MPKRYHFLPNNVSKKPQKIKNSLINSLHYSKNPKLFFLSVAKVIFSKYKSDHIPILLKTLQWFYISFRVKANVLTMVYEILHKSDSKSYD